MLLNIAMKCWGIAEPDPDPTEAVQTAPPSVRRTDDHAAVISRANPSTPSTGPIDYRARASLPSESRRMSNVGDCVFPQELRQISSSRRASATVTAPTTFPRIHGVNYESLASVLGNSLAKAQLMAVAIEQRCAENLEFLDALNALCETSASEARCALFSEMFTRWICDDANPQVNLFAATKNAFAVAHATCAANPANATSIVGVGTAFDRLLNAANSEVRRMLQTPMRELQTRLPKQSLELNAA